MPEPDTAKVDARWADRLRERGMRVTRSRLEVLRVLGASPSPMQAQEIIEALSDEHTDRVTVYRTLNSLVESGMAHKVDPGDRVWRYGLLASASRHGTAHGGAAGGHEAHAHFVCDDCGTIRCLEDATIRVSLNAKPDGEKFKITQKDVYLHGTCEKCLEE
ncbi:MAG: Fur family transcriptional regulator [Phycisphaerales bacterium]